MSNPEDNTTLAEIAENLLEEYSNHGVDHLVAKDGKLFAKARSLEIEIPQETLFRYWNFKEVVSELITEPTDCSIATNNYVELLLENVSVLPYEGRLFRPISFSDPKTESDITLTIGPVSDLFFERFRFHDAFTSRIHPRRLPVLREGACILDRSRRGFYTVQVSNLDADSVESALTKASPMIDACLYELLQKYKVNYRTRESWAGRQSISSSLSNSRIDEEEASPTIPRAIYNEHLLSFYHFANASPFPIFEYLSYYQIMEYFYDSIPNRELYRKLRQRMMAVDFCASDSQLEKIYASIRSRERAKEDEKLLQVLEHFVDPQLALDFVIESTRENPNLKWTSRRMLFGKEMQVPTDRKNLLLNLSKRIKHIRNALVHSSDAYEQQPRHIPFTEESRMLATEVPIVKFLAEKIIEGSAEFY